MKGWAGIAAALVLAACSAGANPASGGDNVSVATPDLPNLGAAPELTNEIWLNTDQPLRLADVRGKVVLIDMWTFG